MPPASIAFVALPLSMAVTPPLMIEYPSGDGSRYGDELQFGSWLNYSRHGMLHGGDRERAQAAHETRVERLRAVALDSKLRCETMPKHVFFAWCYRNASFLRLKGLERGIAACLAANEPVSPVILARQFVQTAAHYISTTLYIENQLRKSPPDLSASRKGWEASGASCPRWSMATRPNKC